MASVTNIIYLVFFCICLTVTTSTRSAATPKHGSNNNSSEAIKTNSTDIDFRLKKLLGIGVDRKSETLKTYLKDTIQEKLNKSNTSQVHRTNGEKEPTKAIVQPQDSLVRIPQPTISSGQETLLVLLNNLSKEIQEVKSSLKTLEGDIGSLKEKTSLNPISEAATAKRNLNSVGPNYNPQNVIETTSTTLPKNCKEVQENGYTTSGIYEIRPRHSEKSFMVLCDMETNGGGWTHIQNRFDGSQNFFLEWRFYKFGFGDLEREFWLGLENIYLLTAFEVNELLIEIVDRDNQKATAKYNAFGISSEHDGYNLHVLRGFSGDAGDSLSYHFGSNFSTIDFDQDDYSGNCAEMYKGGWWYKTCHYSHLNGKYINVDLPEAYKFQGLHWLTFRGLEYCHSKSRMLVRPA